MSYTNPGTYLKVSCIYTWKLLCYETLVWQFFMRNLFTLNNICSPCTGWMLWWECDPVLLSRDSCGAGVPTQHRNHTQVCVYTATSIMYSVHVAPSCAEIGLPEQVGFGSSRLNFHLATGTKELFVILLVLNTNARHFVALYFLDCHSLYMYI